MINNLKAAAIDSLTGKLASEFFPVKVTELDLNRMKTVVEIRVFDEYGPSTHPASKGACIKEILYKGSNREYIYPINTKWVFNNDCLVVTKTTEFNLTSIEITN